MYIELRKSDYEIPRLGFKSNRRSNVVKKSELVMYQESRALLMAMEDKVTEYQRLLENQILELIEEKERELNESISKEYKKIADEWVDQQMDWFFSAEQILSEKLIGIERMVSEIKNELKTQIALAVSSRLTKLSQSENLINHLIDVLHAELEDEAKTLKIQRQEMADGVALTIENSDSVVSINTQKIVEELRGVLESI
ncbi:hypothetical protein [Vibrio parahaemolyticus]|uniref:hypothetical protein n=1 Tax=Vibrio parahaemolyticus TaxID=670 RepID=UPI00226AE74B|nr:hypothetical protein [Vibrio parahaemolyticus]MCX8858508.1 hypothetical protein [Vibrio parahaemolyticus]MCX8865060.1 hypothetical protein [Vibrio parahaemolyticus]MCX8869972.1 hypothetical protein [Vibrio parahaemolyticus]MCX8900277.1 hypothetical protein [Vibrio parahaemolyticus]MCX8920543.1 hypothetical protein [Vibrio parahaemolyticus]